MENDRIYAVVDGLIHTTTAEGEPLWPIRQDIQVTIAVQFNAVRMKKLVALDPYLSFALKNLGIDDEERGLRVIFHSEVLNDSVYEDQYMSISM